MPTTAHRMLLAIITLGTLLATAADSGHHSLQCNAQCMDEVRRRSGSYKIFLGATENEWQAAFADGKAELAQGDWSQRLSEIQQEYCGTPGKVDYKKVGAMEMEMAKRLALERGDLAASIRNDPESASATRRLRVQAIKEIIFQATINQFRVDCYTPPSPANPKVN